MPIDRRQLFQAAVASVAAASATNAQNPSGTPDWTAVRKDFPWLQKRLWLSAADYHPIGIHSYKAMEDYLKSRLYGDEGFRTERQQTEAKELFARLINARPAEIAFVQSTTDGENIVVSGMDLARQKGNIVLDDLAYQSSKFLYTMLQKEHGLEMRVVRHRTGKEGYLSIDRRDMEKAIDRNTRLVTVALVSNINGYLHDIRSTTEIAHKNGAYVYGDIIQAAGGTPVDVRAMGIDFASCGAYKWLMGDFGFGFLYVREELQDSVVKRSRYGVRQFTSPNRAQADSKFDLRPGAARYESGSLSYIGVAGAHAALKYIHSLGIENIRAHAKPLTDRLQRELPRMGYPALTPPDNPTPIVSFRLPEYEKTAAKLRKAFQNTVVALRRWEFTSDSGEVRILPGMRISPSVYNNEQDIDRLLEALA
jgi:selenocysteine lyase/cysteine desulfurase